MIWGLLAQAEPGTQNPKAIMVPHAGYPYSGAVAAKGYRAICHPELIQRVILLGPSHRIPLTGIATSEHHGFSSPMGRIDLDLKAIASISSLPEVMSVEAAHTHEHSLEVQLPFLKVVLDDFELVPLVIGADSEEALPEVLGRLWGGPETLIVISSDLSHFLTLEQCQIKDGETLQRILALDTSLTGDMACGCHALNGFLTVAKHYDLKGTVIDQDNSFRHSEDRSRVVGYGAIRFD